MRPTGQPDKPGAPRISFFSPRRRGAPLFLRQFVFEFARQLVHVRGLAE